LKENYTKILYLHERRKSTGISTYIGKKEILFFIFLNSSKVKGLLESDTSKMMKKEAPDLILCRNINHKNK
jgi:hypothetical protein